MKGLDDSKGPANRLKQALGLRERDVISLVGGGGKTTLMFCLARELRALGDHLITTTTTKIREPGIADTLFVSLGETKEAILENVRRFGHITVASRRIADGKLQGISPQEADALWESGGVNYLIIEADGAAQKPLKAPESYEPVIPSCTTVVVGLVGADGLGARLTEEMVFRSSIFSRITGAPLGAGITCEAVSLAFTHKDGLLRGTPPLARIVFFVNKVEPEQAVRKGREFAGVVLDSGDSRIERVILGSLKSDPQVVEVILRNREDPPHPTLARAGEEGKMREWGVKKSE